MKLVNKTPFAAQLFVGLIPDTDKRFGQIVAKATFAITSDNRLEVATDEAYPIFTDDQETPLGLLPRDDLPKRNGIDVIVLGKAYAPQGHPVSRMTISFMTDQKQETLYVFGDRSWETERRISEPKAFTVMPLTYENAFGGKAEIEIDDGSFVSVTDPRNPEGKGFDPSKYAANIQKLLGEKPGFPRYSQVRELPNLEHPQHLITSWNDSPEPVCWSALPLQAAFNHLLNTPPENIDLMDLATNVHRAHPSLVLPPAPFPWNIALQGMTANGQISFQAPELVLSADFLLGERHLDHQLQADTIVILPEERRVYIVYRFRFNFTFKPRMDRAVRLRLLSHSLWLRFRDGRK